VKAVSRPEVATPGPNPSSSMRCGAISARRLSATQALKPRFRFAIPLPTNRPANPFGHPNCRAKLNLRLTAAPNDD
jgi:hypothetical protein